MSIGVALDELRAALDGLERAPYLVTVGDDGRPHAVAVPWRWRDDELDVPAGNRSLANAGTRPDVTLLWPANDADGYTLIVDATVVHTEGTGTGDNLVRVRPTRAVLHRPATGPTDTACGADCVPLTATPDAERAG
ncbi:MAG TPA: pyridoxamine 5'-phosphate oxidase family protein [Acidimicrobiia bacterium]